MSVLTCSACAGDGHVPSALDERLTETCPECRGVGDVELDDELYDPDPVRRGPDPDCPICGGSGWYREGEGDEFGWGLTHREACGCIVR